MIYHGVDGVLQLQNFTLDVHGDLLRQIASRHRLGDIGDVAHLAGQIAGHGVHAVGQVFPRARHALHIRLTAQNPFGTDFARYARDFRGERSQLIDHLVDGLGGPQKFALQRLSVDLQCHRLRQVSLRDRADDARGFTGRMDQIIDEDIDRRRHRCQPNV